jgi:methylmalonyl-CoA/ethylmalonyl-CoA epimerase
VILGVHHVGLVVRDIAEVAATYQRRYGYQARTEVIHDPVQTAYVQFFALGGGPVYLELVAPDSEHSKLSNALSKGGGLNHICYTTDDIDAACRDLRAEKMILIQPPTPAAAFPGRRIAWLMGLDRTPVELVERGGPHDL